LHSLILEANVNLVLRFATVFWILAYLVAAARGARFPFERCGGRLRRRGRALLAEEIPTALGNRRFAAIIADRDSAMEIFGADKSRFYTRSPVELGDRGRSVCSDVRTNTPPRGRPRRAVTFRRGTSVTP
jgi:hypothetical protein